MLHLPLWMDGRIGWLAAVVDLQVGGGGVMRATKKASGLVVLGADGGVASGYIGCAGCAVVEGEAVRG
jgi:hypothetical protein